MQVAKNLALMGRMELTVLKPVLAITATKIPEHVSATLDTWGLTARLAAQVCLMEQIVRTNVIAVMVPPATL